MKWIPSGSGIRETDVTATFEMDITQQGNQITIMLNLNPISWVTDHAYWQEYGITAAPQVGSRYRLYRNRFKLKLHGR